MKGKGKGKGTSPFRVIRALAEHGIQVPRWEVRSLIHSRVRGQGKSMSAIVTIAIDLAKMALLSTALMPQASLYFCVPMCRVPSCSNPSPRGRGVSMACKRAPLEA